ncbi:MAG: peptide-binding protein [Planctomycetota bacterium]|jgi:peptide/nickel transport system substrate-binding protein|nr:peptide-binding protein [Planctomycetota bacterium]
MDGLCAWWTVAVVAAAMLLSGCRESPNDDLGVGPQVDVKPELSSSDAVLKQPVTPAVEPEREPFDPPALADLDQATTWIDRPVQDGLVLLRAAQAEENLLCSTDEALTLKNDSADTNAKILSALGRLPADGEADLEARIDRHVMGDLGSTNPIMISTSAEFDILGLTGFGLFSFGRDLDPFAAAETVVSWQTSADGLLDKVVMRDDLVWSDGSPITAHDIAFSYTVIMDPRVPVPAVRSGTDQLRGVHAYDDHTIVFFHQEPLATNVWNINFPVLPKHVYEKTWEQDPTLKDSPEHVALEQSPIVGGPYEIVERTRGQQIVLRRRENWSAVNGKKVREEPFFKEVRFRIIEDPNTSLLALKAGDIHEMILTPEQWTTQTTDEDFYQRNTKANAPEWVSFHLGWNIESPFFADRRVRRAMSYAFDYDEMLDKLCYGLYQPCAGNFPDDSWMAPKKKLQPYKQDLDTAEALLDEAGWIDRDNDGIRDKEIDGRLVPFEFSILCSQQPLRIAICVLMKDCLDRIGVRMNVKPVESTVLQDLTQKRKFQAYFGGWGSGTDPDTSENIWKTGAMRNFVNYSNPEVDRLYEEGRRELDRAKRAGKYARIQEILYEDQPYTWLFWRNSFYGFSKRVRGYVFSPRGPFHYSPGFGSLWMPSE